jgi:hypothetical protein
MVKQGADLGEPRHWVHYLYFPDESTARDAAAGELLWAPPAADVVVRGRP